MRNFTAITGLFLAFTTALCGNANATGLCWVERVELTANGLRVFHSSGVLNGIKRVSTGAVERPEYEMQVKGYFDLQEGDSASLRNGAHDWCSVRAERHENVLGIEIDANSRPHGLPLMEASSFIAAEKAK